MRRVVVTGMGIVSSIGNTTQEVLASLREAKSGIVARRQVRRARLPLPGARRADARSPRTWSTAARCASMAAAPPGITSRWIRRSATPGSRRATSPTTAPASSWARAGPRRAPSWRRPTPRAARGRSASARSRCRRRCPRPRRRRSPPGSRSAASTIRSPRPARPRTTASATRAEMIQWGKQDMVFAGGCEELDWTLSVLFDAMGAMSTGYNQTPEKASRAYDVDRDGFVIAGGAGVLVLEELEHAKARGAKIYAEVAGYGATSDGHDMVAPSGEGAARCMQHGARRREGAGRLHQSARHLDADRRHQGDRGDPRGVRRQGPADLGDQVADRPLARRRRRAGGDLLAADDEQRLHLRKRQYREPRSRPSPTCRSCASGATT